MVKMNYKIVVIFFFSFSSDFILLKKRILMYFFCLTDKVPETARCNFESGWCGWNNVPGRPLNWTLHQGPTPTERTGPSYDHTYRNETGTSITID